MDRTAGTARDQSGGGRPRAVAAALCLVLAAVLVPLSVAGWWVRTIVTDTDGYVATVAPLAEDADVQDAVVRRVRDRATDRIDEADLLPRAATGLEEQGVPPELARALTLLAEPLRERIEDRVERATGRLVRSDVFADSWRSANEAAHAELVAVLEGESDLVEVTDDSTVSIRLASLVNALEQALLEAGVPGADRLEPADASFPIGTVEELSRARDGYRLLRAGSLALPAAAVLLAVVGVLLARRRSRAVVVLAEAGVVALLLLLVAVSVARGQLLGSLPPDASTAAAGAVYDAVAGRLRLLARTALVLLVVLGVTALFVGRDEPAARRRASVGAGVLAARTWLAGNRPARYVALGAGLLAVVLVLLLPDPRPAVLLPLVLAAVVAAAVVHATSREPGPPRQ